MLSESFFSTTYYLKIVYLLIEEEYIITNK